MKFLRYAVENMSVFVVLFHGGYVVHLVKCFLLVAGKKGRKGKFELNFAPKSGMSCMC